jgi:pyruvate-formate lyase
MRFHPHMLRTEQGLETFASMIRTYFSLGGMHLQPNVVSGETLREAQRSPERYRDLVVKVSGYSAYFTDLGRSIQEDIIARTEFGA